MNSSKVTFPFSCIEEEYEIQEHALRKVSKLGLKIKKKTVKQSLGQSFYYLYCKAHSCLGVGIFLFCWKVGNIQNFTVATCKKTEIQKCLAELKSNIQCTSCLIQKQTCCMANMDLKLGSILLGGSTPFNVT